MTSSTVYAYLRPSSPHAFWRWEDRGRVVAWRDGRTIAFREEILQGLEGLAAEGLPEFDALLLGYAALRRGWKEDQNGPGILLGLAHALQQTVDDVASMIRSFLPDLVYQHLAAQHTFQHGANLVDLTRMTLQALDSFHRVCHDLARTPHDKTIVLQLFFGTCRQRGDPRTAREVITALKRGIEPEGLQANAGGLMDSANADRQAARELVEVLCILLEAVLCTVTSNIDSRLRTGLDAPPKPAPIDQPPRDAVRRLLEALRNDSRLGGMASLARDLMAVTHIPRRVADREDLPTGGVTDISNRGPLDRLLISELANDDLTLAVRIALNEALYLRREAPPREPQGARTILVDVGIRMWGIPRVYSAAVALALAATAERGDEIHAFRAAGCEVVELDLTSREGLEALLEALESDPDPRACLARLIDRLATSSRQLDVIIVTHENTLADPAFTNALGRELPEEVYVATVDGHGRYRLSRHSAMGSKALQEATLSLEQILAPEDGAHRLSPPLTGGLESEDLPHIFALHPFPLRLSYTPKPQRLAEAGDGGGMIGLTNDGRLLHWDRPGWGARQVASGIAPRTLHFITADEEGSALLILRDNVTARVVLTRVDLESGKLVYNTIFPTRFPPRAFLIQAGALFMLHDFNVESFDVWSGTAIAPPSRVPNALGWLFGRTWRGSARGQYHLLARDCREPAFVTLETEQPALRAIFDRKGSDGPWGLAQDGGIHDLTTCRTIEIVGEIGKIDRLLRISPDGNLLLVATVGGSGWTRPAFINLPYRQAWYSWWDPAFTHINSEGEPVQLVMKSVRANINKIKAIGVAADSRGIVLQLRTDRIIRLGLDSGAGELEWRATTRNETDELRPLRPVSSPAVTQIRLARATWPDGSRAYVDARGLLHLVSSDRSIPQIAIVLVSDGVCAGWNFLDQYYGDEYFTGDNGSVDADTFAEPIRRFVDHILGGQQSLQK